MTVCHTEALDWLRGEVAQLDRLGLVVDVGAHVPEHLFRTRHYEPIELTADLPAQLRRGRLFRRADLVVCAEVLQHSDHPAAIIRACRRALRRGGLLLVTTASPVRSPHAGITPNQMWDWLSTWATSEVVHAAGHGDLYARAVR